MNCDFTFKDNYDFEDLVAIVKLLRSENGCAWDREQTHKSMRKDFIEEVYEVIEAIDTEDKTLLTEELGDVLLQVVFHSRIAEENGDFDINDVADGICKKLIHRHPHVFGDVKVKDSAEILENWGEIKKKEKRQTTPAKELDDVARSLPSLMRTQKIIKRGQKANVISKDNSFALAGLVKAVSEIEKKFESPDMESLSDLLYYAAMILQNNNIDGERLLYDRCEDIISHEKEKNMCS
ncbi:MAG: MazG family protein [Clostridiales bacterium]|nr:MazG family protein [Clostridiales bacterium]